MRVGCTNRQLRTTINGNGETLTRYITRAGVEREGVGKSKSFAAFLHFKRSEGKYLRDIRGFLKFLPALHFLFE